MRYKHDLNKIAVHLHRHTTVLDIDELGHILLKQVVSAGVSTDNYTKYLYWQQH